MSAPTEPPVPPDSSDPPVPPDSSEPPVPPDSSEPPVPPDISEPTVPPDIVSSADLLAPLFLVRVRGPRLHVVTPFALPDGDLIAVFVLRHSDPPLLGDLGETLRWLRSHTSAARRSDGQHQRILEVCAGLGVELQRGELRTHARPGEPLALAVVRLAQACLRVAELWRGFRPRPGAGLLDEVEACLRAELRARPLGITRGERIAGISATTWSADFRVRTPERHTLIFVLASERRDHARKLAEHVVAACTDLAHLRKLRRTPVQFIALFDDRGAAWSDADARLVAPFAIPCKWSERATWLPLLELPAPGDDDTDDPTDLHAPHDDASWTEEAPHPDSPPAPVQVEPTRPGRAADGDPPIEPLDPPAAAPEHAPDAPRPRPPALRSRPATTADYPDFTRLYPELVTAGDPTPDLATWDAGQRPSALFFEEDGEVVAYVHFEVLGDLAWVHHIVVDPGFRGLGLGYAVMHGLAAHLRALGCARWRLTVRPDNAPALRLYRGVGMLTAYRARALSSPWALLELLPSSDLSLTTCPIDPVEDDRLAAGFGLPRGLLARLRADPGRVLLRLRDPTAPDDLGLGFAVLDPQFGGAHPFRAARPDLARPLLLALRLHLPPDAPMAVVVEDDDALIARLLAAGARPGLELLHLHGPLPPERAGDPP